jgi:hypothetical protein
MQGTDAGAAGLQETTRVRSASVVYVAEDPNRISRGACVAIALAIAVPLTLIAGAALGFALKSMLW